MICTTNKKKKCFIENVHAMAYTDCGQSVGQEGQFTTLKDLAVLYPSIDI